MYPVNPRGVRASHTVYEVVGTGKAWRHECAAKLAAEDSAGKVAPLRPADAAAMVLPLSEPEALAAGLTIYPPEARRLTAEAY